MRSIAALSLVWLWIFVVSAKTSDVDKIFISKNFSGVAVVRRGPELWDTGYRKAFGFFNWEFQAEMPTTARFPIASNTKLYVAVSLYQLQERGLVNLTHNVADYIDVNDWANFGLNTSGFTRYCPQTANGTECQNMTFVQLMDMTAGIGEGEGFQYLPFPGSIGLDIGRYIQFPLRFVPGSQYYYSNPSFIFCAYFIEKFSGMSFEAYLKQHIFNPLGLKDTKYDQYNQAFRYDPKRASEYRRYLDPVSRREVSIGKCLTEIDEGSANGAGGIVSTVDDQAKWWYSLFNFTGNLGGGILTPASVYEIVKARTWVGGNTYYAQGLGVINNDPTNPIPQTIFYQGGQECTLTFNNLDLKATPYIMSQVWTNTIVLLATEDEVLAAENSQYGRWSVLTSTWKQLTQKLYAMANAAQALVYP